jgi:uncharacterized lipoprotein YajG
LVLSAAGCQAGPASAVPKNATVRGHVVDVQARDIRRAEAVQVRTQSGEVLRFNVAESVEVTPGHLREHMVQGEPVTVKYETRPDGLLATAIDD